MPGTLETLAQIAPYAGIRHFFSSHQLSFAFTTEEFFASFHGSGTRRDGHWAKINTGVTLLAEVGLNTKWLINFSLLAPTYESNGLSLPHFAAHPHTSPTQSTVLVSKRIAYLRYPTPYRDILNSSRVRRFSYQ